MAVNITEHTLASYIPRLNGDPDRARRWLIMATPIIERYAPEAPQVLQNEALVRFVAYMVESGTGAVMEKTVGPVTVKYITNHSAMFRNSGAASLLTPYKKRRAGAI